MNDRAIRRVVVAGLLTALTLLLSLTPIGFIPMPTPAGSATIAHIPAIIAGILEGPFAGAIVGLGFGVGSLLSPLVPVKDPLVVGLPRIMIGVVSALAWRGLRRANKTVLLLTYGLLVVMFYVFVAEIFAVIAWLAVVIGVAAVIGSVLAVYWLHREESAVIALAISGAAGSLTNTVLVLSMAVLLGYIAGPAAPLIAVTHGIPEAVVSAVIVVAVVAALREVGERRRGARL